MPANVFRRAYAPPLYDDAQSAGVMTLVVAGMLSALAVLFASAVFFARLRKPSSNQIAGGAYFVSLLTANLMQAIGTSLNAKWVVDRAVEGGRYCSFQGGLKQAGNVGMALWSFVLSLHVFRLLFMRSRSSPLVSYIIIGLGWAAIAVVVAIGPLAIQSPDKGPYFGPSGHWCWITDDYPLEQTYLEYFFEFLSSGLSLLLYVAILLRVRGNLIRTPHGWRLRFVPRGARWLLAINRDWLDTSLIRVAARLLWYPVSYVILLLPISLSRLYEFGGGHVPFGVMIFSDTLFNLQGFVNAVLLFTTHRLIPDPSDLPTVAPRKVVDLSSSTSMGITPFTLTAPQPKSTSPDLDVDQHAGNNHDFEAKNWTSENGYSPHRRDSDTSSVASHSSMDSHTPLSKETT